MQTTYFLSEKDYSLLSQLLHNQIPGLFPVPAAINALTTLLAKSTRYSSEAPENDECVGLGDRVALVSPSDPTDSYEPSIVLPAEANPDDDRLSILTPIGLAVMGRRKGDIVTWETPRGTRRMKISAVWKTETAPS
ncbi:MAG: GreA/GreB family elongation factor [Luteolibacter sp.]